ncbi:MAG: hypothetical protein DBY14_02560 [Escherichia coli]|nr:MAG: hypothetical protein DBY14_02560 [Escherichia coli]
MRCKHITTTVNTSQAFFMFSHFNILIKIIKNYNNFIIIYNVNYFHAWCRVLLICFIDTFLFKSYNLHDNIHIFEFRRWCK